MAILLLLANGLYGQVRPCPEEEPCDKEEVRMRYDMIQSDLDMTFHATVATAISHVLHRSADKSGRIIGLAETYFPLIEDILLEEGVPIELKYMAVVESRMHPQAVSRAGAVGMWQFMPYTGKMYGLEVENGVDERLDFYKSTKAAAHFMRDLYDRFGDWSLAMAAYNCGPGRVNKAIRRSGGKKTFWGIQRYLPKETRKYVPRIMAEMYFMYYHSEYHIYPHIPNFRDVYVDVEEIHYDTDLEAVASRHNILLGDIMLYNPELHTKGIDYLDLPYTLRIPAPYDQYELGHVSPYVHEPAMVRRPGMEKMDLQEVVSTITYVDNEEATVTYLLAQQREQLMKEQKIQASLEAQNSKKRSSVLGLIFRN
ncbi:lytic transglycosylase domain-containing protein [Chitinophagales bacterium]|nr:lytic transglycosylase domain-containing protein [Chitinophagales bacterium]